MNDKEIKRIERFRQKAEVYYRNKAFVYVKTLDGSFYNGYIQEEPNLDYIVFRDRILKKNMHIYFLDMDKLETSRAKEDVE